MSSTQSPVSVQISPCPWTKEPKSQGGKGTGQAMRLKFNKGKHGVGDCLHDSTFNILKTINRRITFSWPRQGHYKNVYNGILQWHISKTAETRNLNQNRKWWQLTEGLTWFLGAKELRFQVDSAVWQHMGLKHQVFFSFPRMLPILLEISSISYHYLSIEYLVSFST